jgi:heptosyltransferase-1
MTSRDDKLWPEASWVELARALGMRVVLPWGSDAERARAERIAREVPGAEVPPRLSLGELGALFTSASQVVGVDTGLTHLAAALGAPTLGLYCGSDPALTGIYGAPRAKNLGAPGKPPAVSEVLQILPSIQ